ncbi:hypothetical protein PQX77_010663, partial [Marasmius sp. AFHP31]
MARRIRIKRLSWDDAWAVVATVLSIIFVVLGWVSWALVSKTQETESQPEFIVILETLIAALTFSAI